MISLIILPKSLTSSNEPGGGNGKPLFVGNMLGRRPVPSVDIGKRLGGGGGSMFGVGKRLNGDGRLSV